MRYGRPSTADASRQYQVLALSSRLEAASPHHLVSILYDELEKALAVLLAIAKRGGTVCDDPNADRARVILLALTAGLDLDRGGALAATLASVYRAMSKTLSRTIKANDQKSLADLQAGVLSLGESWQKIAD